MRSLSEPRAVLVCLLALTAFACGGGGDGNLEPAVATNIAENGGSGQSAAPGNAVANAPSVKVTDASANPVGGVAVTFAVASGGGSITGANQTTDASGIATVGSWTLGSAAGTNTLTASASGLTGSPVTFTATGTSIPAAATFESLVAGLDHTCGLTADGTAYCWGWNQFGQVGDGTTTDRLVPTRVSGDVAFQSLSLAGAHTCGIAAGIAYCWGRNADGELGDGTITQRLSPTPVTGGLAFQSLAGGFFHTCGLTVSGAAHCWGENENGQLGDGTTTSSLTPAAVTGALTFRSLTGGGYHTCGLTTDGAAHCWGHGLFGQMGNGTVAIATANPVAVAGELTFQSLEAGAGHNCGLTSGELTHCWGFNSVGQLGDGTTTDRLVPTVIGTGPRFQSLAMGNGQSCGIAAGGAAYCWGFNTTGQVGDGTTTHRSTPVAVAGGLTWKSLTAGAGYHTCGLTTSGLAYCWGPNGRGGLGDGTTSDRFSPAPVSEIP